jgi:transposase
LVAGELEYQLLDALLNVCQRQGWLKAGSRSRTDSTHVLAAVEHLHRYELVKAVLEAALNRCAQVAPDWLKARVPPVWFSRYGQAGLSTRPPKSETDKQALAQQIGRDGVQLLGWLAEADAPPALQAACELQCLHQVWPQQYVFTLGLPDQVQWRDKTQLPAASQRIASPYDTEARYSTKGRTEWVGYKIHVTETCEADAPHLITHVATTVATEQDIDQLDAIHDALAQRHCLPGDHLVDSGYVSAEQLVKSQSRYGVNLVGPVRPDVSWQAQSAEAYDVTRFQIDWTAQQVRCPQGKVSRAWHSQTGVRGNPVIEVNFAQRDCSACPAHPLCTRSAARILTLLPQMQFEALQARRRTQTGDAFRQLYRARAGVEGTISEAATVYGARRSRYIGLAKTGLQHIATAVAMNLQRLYAWLNGDAWAKTRVAPFAALAT